ncbi:cytochrome-c peroxidase [Moraxella sp. ZJ142]|uniref:cytochrome-c peroxidase n=1 Tax=Moraxella marmotae TaxID=3344520 RepID=UPI0035D3EA88
MATAIWLALVSHSAAAGQAGICQNHGVYDYPCLRKQYAKPISNWPKPVVDAVASWQEFLPILPASITPDDEPKVALGKELFFEKSLSDDAQVSCASCHNPDYAFTEPRVVSQGVFGRQGRRNSQSLVHLGLQGHHGQMFFWDGRAKTLGEQILLPLTDPNEMNITLDSIPARLESAGYRPKFQAVFGSQPQAIDIEQMVDALSAYLTHLRPSQTRFDKVLMGEIDAFGNQELLGMHLFRTKARCMNCHFGQTLSDGKLHNLNQTLVGGRFADFGAYEITGDVADFGKFKTPSLRNLSQSKPWFHHGRFTNLEGVVEMYNQGMPERLPKNAPPIAWQNHKDPLIQPLGLTRSERKAVVAFLLTL